MWKLKSLQWVPIVVCATQLNPNQPNHYFIALPVRARERQIRAPKKHIIGELSRGSYWDNVTVYPYNGCMRSTNPIVWHVMSLTCTIKQIWCKLRRSKIHRNTTFTSLEHARPGTKSHVIIGHRSRTSYWDNVTVYPYNGCMRSTNPIVWHVMSLTCTLKRIHVNYGTQKHAKTQPLHHSNMRAWAPKVFWQLTNLLAVGTGHRHRGHRRQEDSWCTISMRLLTSPL